MASIPLYATRWPEVIRTSTSRRSNLVGTSSAGVAVSPGGIVFSGHEQVTSALHVGFPGCVTGPRRNESISDASCWEILRRSSSHEPHCACAARRPRQRTRNITGQWWRSHTLHTDGMDAVAYFIATAICQKTSTARSSNFYRSGPRRFLCTELSLDAPYCSSNRGKRGVSDTRPTNYAMSGVEHFRIVQCGSSIVSFHDSTPPVQLCWNASPRL